MTRLPDLEAAAGAAAWGIPFRRLLSERDPLMLAVERHVINRAITIRRENEEAIATMVGNAVARALG